MESATGAGTECEKYSLRGRVHVRATTNTGINAESEVIGVESVVQLEAGNNND